MTDDPLIIFLPSGKRGRFPKDTPILTAARKLGVDIDSVCGGRGLCGRCAVEVVEGTFSKHGITSGAENLSVKGDLEERYFHRKNSKIEHRLGCQASIRGDLVIDVPPESQVHKQIVRKRPEARDIEVDPAIRLYYVEVAEPDMHNPTGDLERLETALEIEWGLRDLECDLRTLQKLQRSLRDGQWKVTVAVHRGVRITHIWPGFHDKVYGLAVDVGSTTIAAHLADLSTGQVIHSAGSMNPQIRFGEDLMSRVSFVMMNPGGDAEMTKVVREGINDLIIKICTEASVDQMDILNATFVGNPIMHHLLLGIDPTELGGAPFALAANSGMTLWATEIDCAINPNARIYVLPCIAGHVGADTAAVILSETPHLSEEIRLIIDVGTNAEIVLGNSDRLLAASSPTGPAFEGAQIACGQRAAPGAIERVRIDSDTLEPRFRVIGSDLWSDEEGFENDIKRFGVTGICGSGIIEVLAEMFVAGILSDSGVIDGALASRSERIRQDGRTFSYVLRREEPEIYVTQNDVRAIQLAKGALYAGAKLLMEYLDVDQVDRVILAGAFGSHIDPKHAMILGLIPDCALDKVTSAGNAAGTGALISLLNQKSRDEIENVIRRVEKIETAVEPKFQEHFVGAMGIPHATDLYPNLRASVPQIGSVPSNFGPAKRQGRRRTRPIAEA